MFFIFSEQAKISVIKSKINEINTLNNIKIKLTKTHICHVYSINI